MITPEHEYFIRFILLILQGGGSLLRCIANKALQKKGMSLNQFLNTVEYKIRSSKLSIKQKSIMFPGTSEGPCIEDFDITLLSHFIIKYLKGELEDKELQAVEHIRDVRNTYQAHATEAKMESKIFTKEWSKLVRFIITIGTKMSEAEQKKLNETIDNIENDQLDIKCVIEEIKRLDESNAFFEKIHNCLEDIRGWQEEVYSEVSDVLEVTQQTSDAVSKIEQITQHTASEVSNINIDTQQTASAVSTIKSTTQQMASIVRKIDDNAQQNITISSIIHKTTQETSAATSNIQENIQQTSADVWNILETTQLALGAVCSANETTQETHANMKDVQVNMKDVQDNTKRMSIELIDVHNAVLDMRVELLKIKEQQENQGKNTKIVNTVFGRVKISADDQKTVDNAEAVLLKATIDCLTQSSPIESHREVIEKMYQFLEDIRKFDVEVQNVRTGSIIFEFRCKSLSGVLDLIDYFYSPCCQKRMCEIAKVLEDLLCKKICVSADIDSQSIRDIITKTDKKEHQKTVEFDMSCTGINGLIHAMNMFEDGKAANSLNELSKALSHAVGKPVTLHTSIDVNQMARAIQNIRDSLDNPAPAYRTPAVGSGAGCSFMSSSILPHEAVPHPHSQEHITLTLSDTINVNTDLDKKKMFLHWLCCSASKHCIIGR